MSLRELHPNVNSNASIPSLDPRGNATIHGFGISVGPGSLMGAEDDIPEDMTMPLLKKSRMSRSTRVNKKTASIDGHGRIDGRIDGRENLPPLATIVPGGGMEIFSQSITRRKSPRLN
jgi:kinesin family protein 11